MSTAREVEGEFRAKSWLEETRVTSHCHLSGQSPKG